MEEFFLSPKGLHAILKKKGVDFLYHANTVLTSLTFINENALLSRAYVEQNNLVQTAQRSDPADKKFNVWDDVFVDGIDIHQKYKRANSYGPVLFVLKLDLLLSPSCPRLLICKNNPMYWKNDDMLSDRYYSDIEEFDKDYLSNKKIDARLMITFRNPEKAIKLTKFLRIVVIDKPAALFWSAGEKKVVAEVSFSRILTALKENSLGHIPLKYRHTDIPILSCKCVFEYARQSTFEPAEFIKRFRGKPEVM